MIVGPQKAGKFHNTEAKHIFAFSISRRYSSASEHKHIVSVQEGGHRSQLTLVQKQSAKLHFLPARLLLTLLCRVVVRFLLEDAAVVNASDVVFAKYAVVWP